MLIVCSVYPVIFSLLQTKAPGRILFDQVCKQLNLLEVDYFGLEYLDPHNVTVSKERSLKGICSYYLCAKERGANLWDSRADDVCLSHCMAATNTVVPVQNLEEGEKVLVPATTRPCCSTANFGIIVCRDSSVSTLVI